MELGPPNDSDGLLVRILHSSLSRRKAVSCAPKKACVVHALCLFPSSALTSATTPRAQPAARVAWDLPALRLIN